MLIKNRKVVQYLRCLIIYTSTYRGNTEKIAKIFADEINADLFNLKNNNDINLQEYDLIGFGSGVYKESISPKLKNFVDKLNLESKNVFVFSTSGVGLKFYNKKLEKLLKLKGANCKGSFSCKGSFDSREFSDNKIFEFMSRFSQGHPNTNDIMKAKKFIIELFKERS